MNSKNSLKSNSSLYTLKKDTYIYIQNPYIHIFSDNMGNVLISLDDEHEKLLRNLSQKEHQGKKGSISLVVTDALDQYAKEKERLEKVHKLMSRLRKGGLAGDYKMYKKRSEIYD
jgi:protein-tyrosine phosphatase